MTNRLKRALIPEYIVLDVLFGRTLLTGLPDGFKVQNVYHDAAYRSFAFVVSHESFDEVLPGSLIPSIDLTAHDAKTEQKADGRSPIIWREFL